MSNWRELQSQTVPQKKVQLKVDFRIECRLVKEGEEKFAKLIERVEVDGEYENKVHESIKGFHIGSFQILEAWDDANACYFQSSPYFNVQNMVWLNHRNKTFKGMMSVEDAKVALQRKGLNVYVKKVVVLATQKGVATVKTNSYLWLNQFKTVQYNDVAKDYVLELKPLRFLPETVPFKSIDKSYYEKMTLQSYPACVQINQMEVMDAKLANMYKLDEVYKNYLEYEAQINAQVSVAVRRDEAMPSNQQPLAPKPMVSVLEFASAGEGDDLPF